LAHLGSASAAVMQKPPWPQTGPSSQAAQSELWLQLVRQTPLTQTSPPVHSLLTLHSSWALVSGMQTATLVLPTVIDGLQVSRAELHWPLLVQVSRQVLLTQDSPLSQSEAWTQVPASGTQMLLLQTWPLAQSALSVQELVHLPSRQTRPVPQCLLNSQVVPPPQSPEQVPHCPSTQSPSAQLPALWQDWTGVPGTQVPEEQTKLPRDAQSASTVHTPELLQVPLLQYAPVPQLAWSVHGVRPGTQRPLEQMLPGVQSAVTLQVGLERQL